MFHAKHSCLPLRGNVPDMKAESKVYIQLQNIYKTKARQDVAEVLETAQSIAPSRQFDPTEVELFCKNAPFVKLINATGGDDRVGNAAATDQLREVTGKFIFAARPPAFYGLPSRPLGAERGTK